jgi:hypothetical protein
MRSSWRTKEHQSGFPHIRQGLRRLTRQKMFEVEVGMVWLPAARFLNHVKDIGVVVGSGSSFYRRLEIGAQQVHFCYHKKDEPLEAAKRSRLR